MFEIIHKIGKGSSGYVYKAINKKDKKVYAIKQSLSKESNELLKNEISVYEIFNNECPHIIQFYDHFQANNETGENCLCMQIEYCQFGSIREIIKKGAKKKIYINELEISSIIYMVLQSLIFIHKKNLIDRDIKGRNILVDKNCIIKLCDFGICKPYHKNKMKKLRGGSPYWMAPEVLNKEEYDQSIDIWALGITCVELAEFEPPYFKLSPKEVMKQIIKSPPKGLTKKEKWSKEFNNFISCCLKINRFERPTAEELLKHDFIKNVESKNLDRRLIIMQFLNKCGYKIIYNRKIKITLNNNKCSFRSKEKDRQRILTETEFLSAKSRNYNILNKFQFNSNNFKFGNKNITNYTNINKITNSTNNISNKINYTLKQQRISLKCSSIFNKKIFIRCQSYEKEDFKNKKTIGSVYTNPNTLRSQLSDYKPCLTTENRNNNIRNLKKSQNLENGSENADEEEELDEKEKVIDIEIQNLMKERDDEIKNIMLKYKDKMERMKREKRKNNNIKKNINININRK